MTEAALELLILAPRRDAELTCRLLAEANLRCDPCATPDALLAGMGEKTGAVLLAEEVISDGLLERLTEKLVAQDAWSDLPFLVVAQRERRDGLLAALAPLGNVTLLQRPMTPDAIATAVASAFRARRRQLQVRDLIEEQLESSRQKDDFMAMLAHELRNPLAPVRYAARILQCEELPAARRRETVDLVERQTGHMARIIDQLLDATRAVRGLIDLAPQRLDLLQLAQEAVAGHGPVARSHGIELLVDGEGGVWVDADPMRLRQVIDNLVDNAIKFSPGGGTVTLRVARRERHAVLTVIDHGSGLDPVLMPRIFEPFVQAGQAMDRRRGGLGLGLSIVRNLARLHGGEVVAESDGPGRGSRFMVHLPLAEPGTAASHGAPCGRSSPGRLRVMVAEDNLDSAESLKLLLEMSGHDVHLAHSGLAAVEETRRLRPDVLICDIGLPGLNGYDVARALRRDPALASMRMIALTGYGSRDDRDEALAAGFDEHVAKPVEPASLFDHMARLARSRPLMES